MPTCRLQIHEPTEESDLEYLAVLGDSTNGGDILPNTPFFILFFYFLQEP